MSDYLDFIIFLTFRFGPSIGPRQYAVVKSEVFNELGRAVDEIFLDEAERPAGQVVIDRCFGPVNNYQYCFNFC